MTNIKGLKKIKKVSAYVSKYIQKEIIDKRLIRQKAYFTSKGLFKPVEKKNQISIDKEITHNTMNSEIQREYNSSKYGRIHYQKGNIIKKIT